MSTSATRIWRHALHGGRSRRTHLLLAAAATAALLAALRRRHRHRQQPSTSPKAPSRKSSSASASGSAEVNLLFLHRLRRLLAVAMPGWQSREAWLAAVLGGLFVLRTYLSVYVAHLDGRIVGCMVQRRGRDFLAGLCWWMSVAVPATFCNAMLTYVQSALALAMRTRLTLRAHELYLGAADSKSAPCTFYQVAQLDDRLQQSDQCMTRDLELWCATTAELYASLAKPVLDTVVYNWQLIGKAGLSAVLAMHVLVDSSGWLLRRMTPPFGRLVAELQAREGAYRAGHARLIEHAEEVALWRGAPVEARQLRRSFRDALAQSHRICHAAFGHAVREDFTVKFLWGGLGLAFSGLPAFRARSLATASSAPSATLSVPSASSGRHTEQFVTIRRMLQGASDAFGRILYAYKDVSELAGYTERLALLFDVFADVQSGQFVKLRRRAASTTMLASGGSSASGAPQRALVASAGNAAPQRVASQRISIAASITDERGLVIESSETRISFDGVPIVSPIGEVLVESLTFELRAGDNLLIVGPNGCGKSSMLRVLAGLWPVYGGTLRKPPPPRGVFYLPQRPYLSLGTLRDQIIYPDSVRDMHERGVADAQLLEILHWLQLDTLLDMASSTVVNATGLDATCDWKDVLSGGDKQRIAMARLFYHRPQFAILDECTSAVSLEMERLMYAQARQLGITLLTVSHRPSLWPYHSHILQFDGHGGYVFLPLADANARLALQQERQQLEARLAQLPRWQARLRELEETRAALLASTTSAGVAVQ